MSEEQIRELCEIISSLEDLSENLTDGDEKEEIEAALEHLKNLV